MSNTEYLIKHDVLYVHDAFEDAVFKFTDTGKGSYCDVKFKGKTPYQVECSTDLAMEALLGGKRITQDEYLSF